ncbi:MAG: xylulose kinase [Deltaproteobacteria bacterium]|nr:xylulose kinase [Deltaproteobacteria bacterium]
MNDKGCILAIDHGTSGIKAAIVSVFGEVLDFEFESTPIHFLPGGGAEQDPEDWWNALVKAASTLVARNSDNKNRILAMAVSSTFSTTVCVDRQGKHLKNAITWMDSRGAPYVKKLVSGFPSIEGYGLSMILKWLPKTGGGPTLSGKDDIAHVLLIKNEFPEIYEKTYMFLPSKDYLNLRLTGKFTATHDSMQLFWMTDIRDPEHFRYDPKLIRAAGIDADKLPPMVAPTDIIGTLLPDVAEKTGLLPETRVAACSPDHQTACVGSGAVDDFAAHLYVGTSSWLQAVVPFKKTDVFHSIASFPSAIPGRYQSVNEQDMAGGCLDFLFNNLLIHDERLCSRAGDPFALVDEIAASVPAGSDNLIFLPWLNGERTPVDDPMLAGGFYNMTKTCTQAHIIRAVLEGVALNTRWSLKYVEKFVGRRLSPITIIGGGGQSDVWCQVFADVLNREIRRAKSPRQANARGAAFIAAVGLGLLKFEEIPGLIKYDRTFSPDPDNRSTYDFLYDAFVRIYRANRKIFSRLNRAKGL